MLLSPGAHSQLGSDEGREAAAKVDARRIEAVF
jgi:hypothetical protein